MCMFTCQCVVLIEIYKTNYICERKYLLYVISSFCAFCLTIFFPHVHGTCSLLASAMHKKEENGNFALNRC